MAVGIESVSSREPRFQKNPVTVAKNQITIPMLAAPAKHAGCPQHGQFEVLVNSPKYAAHGNQNRFIISGRRLMHCRAMTSISWYWVVLDYVLQCFFFRLTCFAVLADSVETDFNFVNTAGVRLPQRFCINNETLRA
jgi:hypothetical protein